jgi:hypothetical protein
LSWRSLLSLALDLHRFVDRGRHWNASRTVILPVSDEDDNENDERRAEIRTMSFDWEGVLLTTGDNRGRVPVYDFNDVRAADVGGRNGISRMESSWSSGRLTKRRR